MTVDTFRTPRATVARIASAIPASLVIVDTVQAPKGSEGPKAITMTRIANPAPSISVIVDACQSPRGSEGLKAMTGTSIATPTHDPRDCDC